MGKNSIIANITADITTTVFTMFIKNPCEHKKNLFKKT